MSGAKFTIEENPANARLPESDYRRWAIRVGMGAIKNVGLGAVEMMIAEREANGPFKSLDDFCERVDLRHVNRLMGMRSIPIHGHRLHLDGIGSMFPYCFGFGEQAYQGYRPSLRQVAMVDDQPVTIAGLEVIPFAMSHGSAGRTTGFRIGGLGYLTDLKELPPSADAHLRGLDLLVLDMLREAPHETHLCWAEAQAMIARLRPRRTVLTHMGHEVRYAEWEPRLPAGVVMARDGLRLPFAPR